MLQRSPTVQAAARNGQALANSPISRRSPVNATSGTTANGSCRLSTTWLSTKRLVVDPSPAMPITNAAGTIANKRVTMRRSQTGRRKSRNPSMTIWPASVPVMVEFCPEASSASANTTLAAPAPSIGDNRLCACSISATSVRPELWNTDAARIRIAALIKNARPSETMVSIVASRIAPRSSLAATLRVCTTDEWR